MIIQQLLSSAREKLVTVEKNSQLTDAATLLGTGRTNLIVVCDDAGTMIGVISKTDIVSKISDCDGHACSMLVTTAMTRDVTCCRPDDNVEAIWELMRDKGYLYIPVINENNQPLGILYARDLLISLMNEITYEESILRDYVMRIGYH